MTDAEIKEFTDWLTKSGHEGGADCEIAVSVKELGRWFGFKRLLFHWTLMTGEIGDRYEIEDRWCYETQDRVQLAFAEWATRKFEGEPEGWHRHPKSSRRRPGGDKSKEYICA